jgi:hypothetical protein
MGGLIVTLILLLLIIGILGYYYYQMDDIDLDIRTWGPLKKNVICPHCHSTGTVHTKEVKRKKGVSGGKATAALLTGGISLLATGLSRKESHLQAHCSYCDVTWEI